MHNVNGKNRNKNTDDEKTTSNASRENIEISFTVKYYIHFLVFFNIIIPVLSLYKDDFSFFAKLQSKGDLPCLQRG